MQDRHGFDTECVNSVSTGRSIGKRAECGSIDSHEPRHQAMIRRKANTKANFGKGAGSSESNIVVSHAMRVGGDEHLPL